MPSWLFSCCRDSAVAVNEAATHASHSAAGSDNGAPGAETAQGETQIKGVPLETKPAKLTEEQLRKKNEMLARYKRRKARQERREQRARERVARERNAREGIERDEPVSVRSADITSVTTASTRAPTVASSGVVYGHGSYMSRHDSRASSVRGGRGGGALGKEARERQRQQRQQRKRRRERGTDVGKIGLFNQWDDDALEDDSSSLSSSSSGGGSDFSSGGGSSGDIAPEGRHPKNSNAAAPPHQHVKGGDGWDSDDGWSDTGGGAAAGGGWDGPIDLHLQQPQQQHPYNNGKKHKNNQRRNSNNYNYYYSKDDEDTASVASSAPRPPEDVPGATLPTRHSDPTAATAAAAGGTGAAPATGAQPRRRYPGSPTGPSPPSLSPRDDDRYHRRMTGKDVEYNLAVSGFFAANADTRPAEPKHHGAKKNKPKVANDATAKEGAKSPQQHVVRPVPEKGTGPFIPREGESNRRQASRSPEEAP